MQSTIYFALQFLISNIFFLGQLYLGAMHSASRSDRIGVAAGVGHGGESLRREIKSRRRIASARHDGLPYGAKLWHCGSKRLFPRRKLVTEGGQEAKRCVVTAAEV
jgi:hypothetical protein